VCTAVVSLNAANRFPVYVRGHGVSVGTNIALMVLLGVL